MVKVRRAGPMSEVQRIQHAGGTDGSLCVSPEGMKTVWGGSVASAYTSFFFFFGGPEDKLGRVVRPH